MTSDSTHLQTLLQKGVTIPHASSVYISGDVNPELIHESVILHPGCRLQGSKTSIGPDCELGKETPATVINCQLGKKVSLKGGYFEGSVFLDGSNVGSAAHIRPGCLFEEEASAAHAVGLKQTILFPFVTLGSLINFCDLIMCGGTSRKNHSEVGSSFIHFNFTPHGDKATASLIGTISKGVLLNQPPIFLGGQGGIVGPVEMEFGVVQAAGSISRKDLMEPGHLYQSAVTSERWGPYQTGKIRDPHEKLRKNLKYIGSLSALKSWYLVFRKAVMVMDNHTSACLEGAIDLLDAASEERVKQLSKWIELLPESIFSDKLDDVKSLLEVPAETNSLSDLLSEAFVRKESYTDTIKQFTPDQQELILNFFETEIQRFTALADQPNEER